MREARGWIWCDFSRNFPWLCNHMHSIPVPFHVFLYQGNPLFYTNFLRKQICTTCTTHHISVSRHSDSSSSATFSVSGRLHHSAPLPVFPGAGADAWAIYTVLLLLLLHYTAGPRAGSAARAPPASRCFPPDLQLTALGPCDLKCIIFLEN